jgi:hypothetical protein
VPCNNATHQRHVENHTSTSLRESHINVTQRIMSLTVGVVVVLSHHSGLQRVSQHSVQQHLVLWHAMFCHSVLSHTLFIIIVAFRMVAFDIMAFSIVAPALSHCVTDAAEMSCVNMVLYSASHTNSTVRPCVAFGI